MNEVFKGFYKSTESELRKIWNSDSTIFIFDTNCLLNLYRCENQTRDDIINLMQLISQRVWIPFQVGYEYQINRKEVIYNSLSSLEKVKKTLKDTIDSTTASINPLKKHLYSALNSEIGKLKEEITSPIESFIKSNIEPRIAQKQKIAKSDSIRYSIDKIAGNKCGHPPTQELIEDINLKGEERYLHSLPPGFRDATKKEESFFGNVKLKHKFGDLYLWMEIIEKAKEDGVNNIIFICDDNKPDWWYIFNGETHGAHAHLLTEIYSETPLQTFKMINQSTFLFDGARFLRDAKVEESSVEEMKATYSYQNVGSNDLQYDLSKNINNPEYLELLKFLSKSEDEGLSNLKRSIDVQSSFKKQKLKKQLKIILFRANRLSSELTDVFISDKYADLHQKNIKLVAYIIKSAQFSLDSLSGFNLNLTTHRNSSKMALSEIFSNIELEIEQMENSLEMVQNYLDDLSL